MFFLKCRDFLNSASSAAALVLFDLTSGRSKHEVRCTRTPRENRERPKSGIYFKVFKKTIFNEQPVPVVTERGAKLAQPNEEPEASRSTRL